MGAAGALASHLGCAAAELASRVASRYVTPRDVGSGLVAGAGLGRNGHPKSLSLEERNTCVPWLPRLAPFSPSVGFTGGESPRAQHLPPTFFQAD